MFFELDCTELKKKKEKKRFLNFSIYKIIFGRPKSEFYLLYCSPYLVVKDFGIKKRGDISNSFYERIKKKMQNVYNIAVVGLGGSHCKNVQLAGTPPSKGYE